MRWAGGQGLFYLSAEGKAALYINDTLIAKDNKSDKVRLQAGSKNAIRVEYAKANGEASLKLEWQSPSQPPPGGSPRTLLSRQRLGHQGGRHSRGSERDGRAQRHRTAAQWRL